MSATTILQTLVAGPRHATEIPMSRSARARAARSMEADGLLVREPGTGNYSLTPAGIKEAIAQGITPPAASYFTDIRLIWSPYVTNSRPTWRLSNGWPG